MQGFKVIKYESDDNGAKVTFIADGIKYTETWVVGEGSRLFKKTDFDNNRSKIERCAIGNWLNKNSNKLSRDTLAQMMKFA